jgi:hypothetical protein
MAFLQSTSYQMVASGRRGEKLARDYGRWADCRISYEAWYFQWRSSSRELGKKYYKDVAKSFDWEMLCRGGHVIFIYACANAVTSKLPPYTCDPAAHAVAATLLCSYAVKTSSQMSSVRFHSLYCQALF